jgi:hypothetical protein
MQKKAEINGGFELIVERSVPDVARSLQAAPRPPVFRHSDGKHDL